MTTTNFSASFVKDAFKKFDKNDDGTLSKQELSASFEQLKDNRDSLTETDQQRASLLKMLNTVFDVLETIDGKSGVSIKDIGRTAKLTGDDDELSVDDLQDLTAKYQDRLATQQAMVQNQYNAAGLYSPTIGVGGMYSPTGGTAMPDYLTALLGNANTMSQQAMAGISTDMLAMA
jgi:hypothetical protein